MKSGVYIIRNSVTGLVYVGSSLYLKKRLGQHRNALRLGDHKNQRFQTAWTTDGEEAFEFKILEIITDPTQLRDCEDKWITKFNAASPLFGYNLQPNARSVGYVHPPESRLKMSLARKGKSKSAQMRARLSATTKGKKVFTAETRAKMSAAKKTPDALARIVEKNKARIWTAEARNSVAEKVKNIDQSRQRDQHGRLLPISDDPKVLAAAAARPQTALGFTGRQHDEASREKMSQAGKGRSKSAEHRAKIGAAHKGKPKSPEAIAKYVASRARNKLEQCGRLITEDGVVGEEDSNNE